MTTLRFNLIFRLVYKISNIVKDKFCYLGQIYVAQYIVSPNDLDRALRAPVRIMDILDLV